MCACVRAHFKLWTSRPVFTKLVVNVMLLEAIAKSYVTDNNMADAQSFGGRNTGSVLCLFKSFVLQDLRKISRFCWDFFFRKSNNTTLLIKPNAICTILRILNHVLIVTPTRFGIHWQGVKSYCSFFSTHPNGGFKLATSEWLKALTTRLPYELI